MLICGIKLTHDGAVAVIDTDAKRLLFSIEVEKLANNPRYSPMAMTAQVGAILRSEGIAMGEINRFVVDGWREGIVPAHGMKVAPYHEFDGISRGSHWGGPMSLDTLSSMKVSDDGEVAWSVTPVSTRHLTGHLIGSYVTSPMAARRARTLMLAWDGGCDPRVYMIDPNEPDAARRLTFQGALPGLRFYGFMYGLMGSYFGPEGIVKPGIHQQPVDGMPRELLLGGREAPGKLMSWIALGHVDRTLLTRIGAIHDELAAGGSFWRGHPLDVNQQAHFEHVFLRELYAYLRGRAHQGDALPNADVLRTLHQFMEDRLVAGVNAMARLARTDNVIFTGGCALNIKWNSALRASGLNLWVPPFCNDSGSALGAAAAYCARNFDDWELEWTVYSGPRLPAPRPLNYVKFNSYALPLRGLAARIAAMPERPVVFMHGRAEIGPRALGARSIIADPRHASMQRLLNDLKQREAWRPVAPMCMEEYAPTMFAPGERDPYMLFDHRVRPDQRERLGAVTHLDGTARLQTVSFMDNPTVHSLLHEYGVLTGCPVLCNTSANHLGKGFFPDVESALLWATDKPVDVYADGVFYEGAAQ